MIVFGINSDMKTSEVIRGEMGADVFLCAFAAK